MPSAGGGARRGQLVVLLFGELRFIPAAKPCRKMDEKTSIEDLTSKSLWLQVFRVIFLLETVAIRKTKKGLGSNVVTVTKFLQLLMILELYLELSY